MIKAIIFDVDGTLVDSVDAHARAWHETLSEFGCDVPYEEVRHQIGKGGDQLMREFLSEEDFRRVGERIERERKDRFARRYLNGVSGFPRVRDLFERIQSEDRKVVLASSAAADELAARGVKFARIAPA